MTSTRDDHPLSRLELVVLARLSVPKPVSEPDLFKDVLKLALLSEAPAQAKQQLRQILERLGAQGFASGQPRRRGSPLWRLTAEGSRALQVGLGAGAGMKGGLSWKTFRDVHLPALAMGLEPGSKQATDAVRTGRSLIATVLCVKFDLPAESTPTGVCDAMIAEALGMPPGPLTLAGIRAHVFARRAAVEVKGMPEEIATRVAIADVRATSSSRESMARALGRRWIQGDEGRSDPGGSQLTREPPQVATPSPSGQGPGPAPAPAPEGAALLPIVRDAIGGVGEEGRFGEEKVFVAALWHHLARDQRAAGLSLERFKRWLVTANRDGWLVLANADLIGAMDPRLLAESEIADRGATFHFVLDRQARTLAAGGGTHAR